MADSVQIALEALAAADALRLRHRAEGEVVRQARLGDTLDEAALVTAALALRDGRKASGGGVFGERYDHDHPAPAKPCSRCGRNIVYAAWGDEEGESFAISFGYGSRFDLETWYLTLCDDCCQGLNDFVAAGQGPGVNRFDYLEERWLTKADDDAVTDSVESEVESAAGAGRTI
jgi:hypothetical protein